MTVEQMSQSDLEELQAGKRKFLHLPGGDVIRVEMRRSRVVLDKFSEEDYNVLYATAGKGEALSPPLSQS